MRDRLLSVLRDRRGATAVEFALVIGPLLLLLVGTMEVGRLYWVQHVLNEAAIAGARCMGIRAPDCAEGEALSLTASRRFIESEARALGVAIGSGNLVLEPDADCLAAGGFSRVRLSHRFTSVLPLLSDTDLTAEACFPNQ